MASKQYAKETYQWYKKLGVCVQCHQQNAELNRVRCFECAEKQSAYMKNAASKLSATEKAILARRKSMWHKEAREKRFSNGLCVKCGKRKISEDKTLCTECLLYNRRQAAKYTEKKKKSPIPVELRNSYGLCRWCADSLEKATDKLCRACFEKRSAATKKLHENPTPAMLRAREEYVKRYREFRDRLFIAPQIQKQVDRLAIENFERMCASCR